MSYQSCSAADFAAFDEEPASARLGAQTIVGAVALILAVLAGGWLLDARLAAVGKSEKAAEPPAVVAVVPSVTPPANMAQTTPPAQTQFTKPEVELFDPLLLGAPPVSLAQSAPLATNFASLPSATAVAAAAERHESAPEKEPVRRLAEAEDIAAAPVVAVAEPPKQAGNDPVPVPRPAKLTMRAGEEDSIAVVPSHAGDEAPEAAAESDPLPVPRPGDLTPPASHTQPLVSRRQIARMNRTTIAAAARTDNRNFFEKFFGMPQQPTGPALAYAAPEDGAFANRRSAAIPLTREPGTAVYDISAHTVYLPDGTRLEAHSGLGNRLDDPRFVNERNRGATPPNVYELTPREQLFHGVRALRLTPLGGTVFGRTGLLAHTFMLGPRGDSNGCVSFRDYNAFLRAYQNGQIRRLLVVAHLH